MYACATFQAPCTTEEVLSCQIIAETHSKTGIATLDLTSGAATPGSGLQLWLVLEGGVEKKEK